VVSQRGNTVVKTPNTSPGTSPGARFAATFVALLAAHQVADYWAQTNSQAANKGRHGNPADNTAGRIACLGHVATYTVISAATVGAANRALRLGANWRGILAGQLVSSATHYFADRRFTLRALAARAGRLEFYDSGVGLATGGAAMDQSWHLSWLAASAIATATVSTPRAADS
jgi:hypothetical protein